MTKERYLLNQVYGSKGQELHIEYVGFKLFIRNPYGNDRYMSLEFTGED